MTECDRIVCDEQANGLFRFPAYGDTRTYCHDCYVDIRQREHIHIERVRTL